MHGLIESNFRVEWRPLSGLADIAPEWQSLVARALEPNVFLEPAFALAAAPVFGHDVGAGLVWSHASPARLMGLFPAKVERRRYGFPLPVLVGWTHPFAPLGTPLIDRDAGTAAISAWLDHVAGGADLPRLLLMPYLPVSGPVAEAFEAALARRGGSSVALAGHERALLAPVGDREHYLDLAIGAKKRKELRRQRKRLADAGTLVSDTVSAPDAVPAALGDFLILDAVRESGGFAIAVDDDAIDAARSEVATKEGVLLCPEGAATYAAYEQSLRDGRVKHSDRVVLFNCASGLKYPMPDAGTPLDRHQPIDYARL
jgi:hypothetical protein